MTYESVVIRSLGVSHHKSRIILIIFRPVYYYLKLSGKNAF